MVTLTVLHSQLSNYEYIQDCVILERLFHLRKSEDKSSKHVGELKSDIWEVIE